MDYYRNMKCLMLNLYSECMENEKKKKKKLETEREPIVKLIGGMCSILIIATNMQLFTVHLFSGDS